MITMIEQNNVSITLYDKLKEKLECKWIKTDPWKTRLVIVKHILDIVAYFEINWASN